MFDEDTFFIKLNGEQRSINDIISENIDKNIKAQNTGFTNVTDFNPGSEAYHAIVQQSMIQYDIEERQDQIDRNNLLLYMQGDYLDSFGASFNINRELAATSTGYVTFKKRASDNNETIIIPEGLKISTDDGVIFLTRQEEVINNNEEKIDVQVICQTPGEVGNVLKNMINIILDIDDELSDKLIIYNNSNFIGGVDEEEDNNYRFKIISSISNYSIGTKLWYEKLINNISGIHDFIYSKNTTEIGQVRIIFKPLIREEGESIKERIKALFRRDENNILGIQVKILIVSYKRLQLDITVTKKVEAIITRLENEIRELIKDRVDNLNINQTITKEELEEIIRTLEDVVKVKVTVINPRLEENETYEVKDSDISIKIN